MHQRKNLNEDVRGGIRHRPLRQKGWWLTYIQTNPIKSVMAVTNGIGGLMLLFFFIQLQAMPDLDFASASSVLLAVAALGFVLAFYLTVCAYGGGWMLRNLGPEVWALRNGRGALLLLMPTAILGIGVVQNCFDDAAKISNLNIMFVVAILICTLIYMYWLPGSEVKNKSVRIKYGLAYFFLSIIWVMIFLMAIISFGAMSNQQSDESVVNWLLLIWIGWCIGCNFLMAQPESEKVSAILGASCLSLIILLQLTNNYMALPKAVVRSLGLGELPVALVVTQAGCEQINLMSGQIVCKVETGMKSALICPVLLRSRIGSPYFLGLSPFDNQGRWPLPKLPLRMASIAVPKSEVLTWRRIEISGTSQELAGSASTSAVTYLNMGAQHNWLRAQCGMTTEPIVQKDK